MDLASVVLTDVYFPHPPFWVLQSLRMRYLVPSLIFSEFPHQEGDVGEGGERKGLPGWVPTWIHKGQVKGDKQRFGGHQQSFRASDSGSRL